MAKIAKGKKAKAIDGLKKSDPYLLPARLPIDKSALRREKNAWGSTCPLVVPPPS